MLKITDVSKFEESMRSFKTSKFIHRVDLYDYIEAKLFDVLDYQSKDNDIESSGIGQPKHEKSLETWKKHKLKMHHILLAINYHTCNPVIFSESIRWIDTVFETKQSYEKLNYGLFPSHSLSNHLVMENHTWLYVTVD